jgi:hypothetical protein
MPGYRGGRFVLSQPTLAGVEHGYLALASAGVCDRGCHDRSE